MASCARAWLMENSFMGKHMHIMVTCEHGGNMVPSAYRVLFRGKRHLLNSHRGYDAGALELAQKIASVTGAILFFTTVTRLLVDTNRSIHNPSLFSEIHRGLPEPQKKKILKDYYLPYRTKVEQAICEILSQAQTVLHISVHSFSPRLKGKVREVGLGLLYDPSRKREKEFCALWKLTLNSLSSGLRIRRNYPYKGISDGVATGMRKVYSENEYLGIELEVNQAMMSDRHTWDEFAKLITSSLLLTKLRWEDTAGE